MRWELIPFVPCINIGLAMGYNLPMGNSSSVGRS